VKFLVRVRDLLMEFGEELGGNNGLDLLSRFIPRFRYVSDGMIPSDQTMLCNPYT